MPHIRRTPSGHWQGVATLPSGKRRSRTFETRRDAYTWAADTEAAAPASEPRVEVAWTPAGLHIHVPDELITMEQASRLEAAIRAVLEEA